MEIRAGDVELDCRNPIGSVQLLRNFQIFFHLLAADVHNDGHIEVAEVGQLLINESINANILQPNRVEHPRWRLKDSWHRISRPRHTGDPFDNDRTNLIQVNEVHVLAAVAKSPRRCHDGVFHPDTGDINFK